MDSSLKRVLGNGRATRALLLAGLVLAFSACSGEYPQSTLHPTADFGEHIDDLYRTIFWWALGVFVVVEAALLFVIIRYRERPTSQDPKHVHGSTLLELAWTLAPAVVLVFIAVPTIQTIFKTDGTAPEGALEIEVIGHQWWWEFRYPEYGITTANEMHVPRQMRSHIGHDRRFHRTNVRDDRALGQMRPDLLGDPPAHTDRRAHDDEIGARNRLGRRRKGLVDQPQPQRRLARLPRCGRSSDLTNKPAMTARRMADR